MAWRGRRTGPSAGLARPLSRGTDAASLQDFVDKRAADDAKVYTDEAKVYEEMPFAYEEVNHSVYEYVCGMAHANGMELF